MPFCVMAASANAADVNVAGVLMATGHANHLDLR